MWIVTFYDEYSKTWESYTSDYVGAMSFMRSLTSYPKQYSNISINEVK